MRVIESRIASIKKESAYSIYIRHKQVSPFPKVEEIKEMIDHLLTLAEDKPFVCLSDCTGIFQNWDSEAKRYVAEHQELHRLKIAHAIVVTTLPVILLIKLYISFFKPKTEMKLFDSTEKAEKWLKEKEKAYFASTST